VLFVRRFRRAFEADVHPRLRGNEISPEPPVTPTGMGKATRGVELASTDELDEAQLVSWMIQAASKPLLAGKKPK
jgi:hypothetical protein